MKKPTNIQIAWGLLRSFLLTCFCFCVAFLLHDVAYWYAALCLVAGVFFFGVFCLMAGRVIAHDWDD